jgi:hypothetical protein
MTDPNTQLAQALATTSANLDAYIEHRAQEIAEMRIAEARAEFLEIRTDMEQEAAIARQRSDDLIAELRRRLDHQLRRADRAEKRLAALQGTEPIS